MVLAVILTGIVSLVLILMGYFIWVKKKLFLIAGYSEETFTGDKDKLARAVGINSIFIGILTFLLPFALEYIGSFTGFLYGIIVVLGTIALIIYGNLLNRN